MGSMDLFMSSMRWEVVKFVFAVGGDTQPLNNKNGEKQIFIALIFSLFTFNFTDQSVFPVSKIRGMYFMAQSMVFQ